MELCDLTAHEITEIIRSKQASAVEVLQSCLKRIAAVDGKPGSLDSAAESEEDRKKVHAFISVLEEDALQDAQKVDRMIQNGEDPGLLAGVPFSAKDVYCVEGTYTTAASKILANFKSPYTATTIQRLKEKGAILVGKVNLDEFTYGSSNESSAFKPIPRNPWNTAYVTGGSSGGSAASVAAGEVPLSLGTDTAGSIRQPAAFCGTVGCKPTYGRVSRYGIVAFASSLDCPGPLSRDVRDAALMLQAIAGADRYDSTAASLPVPNYLAALEDGVRGKCIGLSTDYFQISYPDPESGELLQKPVPDEILAAVQHAADILRDAGAEIIENVPMPNTRYAIPAFFVISRVEAASNLHRYDGVKYGYRGGKPGDDLLSMYRKTRNEGFGMQPKLRVLMGMYVSGAQYAEQYYNRALKVRAMIRRDFERIFDHKGSYRLDALLTPTTTTPAFQIDAMGGDSVLMQYADQFTVSANHAGIPGISLPAGFSNGLPIGIQLLGPDFSEASLLQIGRAFEKGSAAEPWRTMKPEVLK